LTLQLTIFLGLLDDLFDIRWRHKLFIPLIASIPLLIVYRVDFNVTSILLPESLASYLNISPLVDLGFVYYMYMSILLIFCPNSINILAGVNGIEVGQSLVIGAALVANDLLYIRHPQHPAAPSHLFSIYFLLPFLGVSLALFLHNKYPAKVFVGDTYCYFAGMVFASVAVTGHFSKTLMTLLVPQVFNFIFSAPQIFHIVPCPRHRLPRYDPVSDCQYASTMTFTTPPKGLAKLILKVFEGLKFVKLTYDKEGRNILASTNFTLINMWILWVGEKDENGDRRIREAKLCWSLMALQAVCCAAGLGVRHFFARAVFGRDNLGTGIW
jgi:UDP-N-acetylglucosamine--dolichyl-phosphate N-acetylglucosaminephosphotransferase